MECISTARADAASQKAKPGSCPIDTETHASAEGEMTMADSDIPQAEAGTQEILMAEVRYAVVFGEMNELAYGRLHKLLVWVTTFGALLTGGGALALAARLTGDTAAAITLLLGIVTAAAEATRRAYRFDQREAAFREARKAFQDLEGRGWGLSVASLAREVAKLRARAPAGGSWLAAAAFNRACEELGHPERHRPEPRQVRFFRSALAG